MTTICTYYRARKNLDDAFEQLRETIEKAASAAKNSAASKLAATMGSDGRDDVALSMVNVFREAAHRAACLNFVAARAALVGLIRPKKKGIYKTVAVSTRNNKTRSGKQKAFPSDSTLRGPLVRAKGKRAKYRLRSTGKSGKLPKLAILEERKVGRPKVPADYRLYRRKLATCARLKRTREATDAARKRRGWKSYRRKRQFGAKGWSDSSLHVGQAAALGAAKKTAKEKNLAFLKKENAKKLKVWRQAH